MAHVIRAAFDVLPVLFDARAAGALDNSQLLTGDILIHNDSHRWDRYNDSGRLSSYHVSIMLDPTERCDSTPGRNGVARQSIATISDMCIVFRLKPALLNPYASQAADYAKGMVGVAYSTGRALGAGVGSKSFGSGATKRLDKYINQYDHRPKHVICSEMVILCYQFAMDRNADCFIKLDAKHTTPGDMEAYFLKKPSIWSLAGRVKGVQVQG